MWGIVRILYNKNKIKEKVDSWSILWDERYKDNVIVMSSIRDTLGAALKRLGYSMSSRNDVELEKAKQSLIRQKDLVLAYLVDKIKTQVVNKEADLAVMYLGDAIVLKGENENLEYVILKEGPNLWLNTLTILRNTKNKEDAERFINFMTNPGDTKLNAEHVSCSFPSTQARKFSDEKIQGDKIAYFDLSGHKNMEVLEGPSDFIRKCDDIWADTKTN